MSAKPIVHHVAIQVILSCGCGTPVPLVIGHLGDTVRCEECGTNYAVMWLKYERQESEDSCPLTVAILPLDDLETMAMATPYAC